MTDRISKKILRENSPEKPLARSTQAVGNLKDHLDPINILGRTAIKQLTKDGFISEMNPMQSRLT